MTGTRGPCACAAPTAGWYVSAVWPTPGAVARRWDSGVMVLVVVRGKSR